MGDNGFVVRLRGMPWSATRDDVMKFFGDEVNIVHDGIHFTLSREGRPSGEAFVQLSSEEDCEVAVAKHMEHMGSRYIEVFRSKQSEMDWVVKRSGKNQPTSTQEAVLRLRGLPFGCSKEEIAQFFTGLELVPNGIMLPEDRQGRSTGEAYVQFASQDIAERALLKHKERIGHRYIEIFKSSLNEATMMMNMDLGMSKPRPLMGGMGGRPGPYDRNERFMGGGGGGGGMGGGMGMGGGYGRGRGGRNLKGFYEDDYEDDGGYGNMQRGNMGMGGGMGMGMNRRGGNMRPQRGVGMGGAMHLSASRDLQSTPGSHYISKTGHSVHMRGLPFQAIEQDIADFFSPLVPVNCEFEFNDSGRPTGEADVDFSTHQEAVEAMKKHKTNMEHRYIELFLNSTPGNRGDGGFGGGGSMDFSGNMGGSMGGYGGNKMDGGFGNMGGGMGRGRMNNSNYTAF